ncbi:unnamed protein product [Calypogeia fissa]
MAQVTSLFWPCETDSLNEADDDFRLKGVDVDGIDAWLHIGHALAREVYLPVEEIPAIGCHQRNGGIRSEDGGRFEIEDREVVCNVGRGAHELDLVLVRDPHAGLVGKEVVSFRDHLRRLQGSRILCKNSGSLQMNGAFFAAGKSRAMLPSLMKVSNQNLGLGCR